MGFALRLYAKCAVHFYLRQVTTDAKWSGPLVKTFNSIGVGPSTVPQTWTVPQGVFGTVPGELSPTNNYIVSIQLDQVNPTTNILDGRSRTYVNFNISALTAPVYVPTITANGAYQFDIGVTTGQIYPIDPSIATGFNYMIGAGNPDFATVLLPAVQGNDPYTITWDNGQETAKVLGGDVFNFLSTDPLGVSAFTVTGIDPAARSIRRAGLTSSPILLLLAMVNSPEQ